MKKQPEVTATTKRNIMNAFWSLYKEKRIDKITITEITNITGNNRVTFYHYFKDVYAVLEEIEDNLIKEIHKETIQILSNHYFEGNTRDVNSLYRLTFPIFKTYEEQIFTLLRRPENIKFAVEFKTTFKKLLIQFWNLPEDIKYIDYLMEFGYSAMIGLISKWYDNGNDLDDEEFLKMAQGLLANGFLGYINK